MDIIGKITYPFFSVSEEGIEGQSINLNSDDLDTSIEEEILDGKDICF